MWFESQNCAMMGLQATPGKRKLEAATVPSEVSPPKSGRWEAEDCIARLQAVAVPGDTWRSPTPSLAATLLSDNNSSAAPITTLAAAATTTTSISSSSSSLSLTTTTTSTSTVGGGIATATVATIASVTTLTTTTTIGCVDYDDDDDEFDDELSDDSSTSTQPEPARFGQFPVSTARYHHPPPPPPAAVDYWQYYQPPQQQTIRCEENGKSYLELGASPTTAPPIVRARCCDGRTRWCHVPCYRQRRLAVLNLSMCKLARYRQCSDPSLRRSVLICNTLRRLEREMEAEPPEPSYPPPPEPAPPRPSPVISDSYEHSLREMTCNSGRATPFPAPPTSTDTDSGLGDDEMTRPINWGSVLSLSSQTDLEALNNNELYAELGLGDAGGGITSEWKEPINSGRSETDWDGFMHVVVGGT